MTPYQLRVVDEKKDLDLKKVSLANFITDNNLFETLNTEEQARLKTQYKHMTDYSLVLGLRINHFH